MKKKLFFTVKIYLFLFLLVGSFFLADLTVATEPTAPQISPTAGTAETQTPDFDVQQDAFVENAGLDKSPKDPRVVAALVINYAMSILGVMLLAYLVYGGFLIMTSAGEEEKVNNGKSTIRTAIIGLAIMLAAYSIVRLAFDLATGGGDETTPGTGDPNTEVIPGNVPDDGGTDGSADRCTWIFCD